MFLGDANCADGKKDIGLPESAVPWRLLADIDLEIVILLISSEEGVTVLLRSGRVLSKTLVGELVGNSKSGSVRVGPDCAAPFNKLLGDMEVPCSGVPKLA